MNPLQAASALATRMTTLKPASLPAKEPWPKEAFACPHCKEEPKELPLPTGIVWIRPTQCCTEARMVYACQQMQAGYSLTTPADEARDCVTRAYEVWPSLTRVQQRQLKDLEVQLKEQREKQAQLAKYNPRGYVPEGKKSFGGSQQQTKNGQGY